MMIAKARKLIGLCYLNQDMSGKFLENESFMVPQMQAMMQKYTSEICTEISSQAKKAQKSLLRFDMVWLENEILRSQMRGDPEIGENLNLTKEEIKKTYYPDGIYSAERWANSGVPYGDLTHVEVYLDQRDRERREEKEATKNHPIVDDLAKMTNRR